MRQLAMPAICKSDLARAAILAAFHAGKTIIEVFRDGRRLVLPNNKIINLGGIRTGGVPPYMETRDYVTRGKIVYQSISRAGLFAGQARTATVGSGKRKPGKQNCFRGCGN